MYCKIFTCGFNTWWRSIGPSEIRNKRNYSIHKVTRSVKHSQFLFTRKYPVKLDHWKNGYLCYGCIYISRLLAAITRSVWEEKFPLGMRRDIQIFPENQDDKLSVILDWLAIPDCPDFLSKLHEVLVIPYSRDLPRIRRFMTFKFSYLSGIWALGLRNLTGIPHFSRARDLSRKLVPNFPGDETEILHFTQKP